MRGRLVGEAPRARARALLALAASLAATSAAYITSASLESALLSRAHWSARLLLMASSCVASLRAPSAAEVRAFASSTALPAAASLAFTASLRSALLSSTAASRSLL